MEKIYRLECELKIKLTEVAEEKKISRDDPTYYEVAGKSAIYDLKKSIHGLNSAIARERAFSDPSKFKVVRIAYDNNNKPRRSK